MGLQIGLPEQQGERRLLAGFRFGQQRIDGLLRLLGNQQGAGAQCERSDCAGGCGESARQNPEAPRRLPAARLAWLSAEA